ncbi:MAG: ABC transporter substrate-binding protein [Bacillota bacterium]
MRKKSVYYLLVLGVLALLLALTACGKKEDNQEQNTGTEPAQEQKILKIGSAQPFSGPLSAYGESIRPGMEIYADLINQDGGLKIGNDTYKIQLDFSDSKATPEGGGIALNELINKDGDQFILGEYEGLAPLVAITEPKNVILLIMAQAGYDPQTMKHVVFPNPSYELMAPQIEASLRAFPDTKVMAFNSYDVSKQNSVSLLAGLTAPGGLLQKKGIKLVESYSPYGADFSTVASKFIQQNVDFIFSQNGPADDAMLIKDMAEAGHKVNFARSGTLIDLKSFIDMAGYDNVQGMIGDYSAPWMIKKTPVSADMLDMANRIHEAYAQKYGKPEQYVGHYTWGTNHMALLFEALKQAGTTDPDKVMETFRGGTFNTFMGTYTLSGQQSYGSPIVMGAPGVLGKIQGNDIVYGEEEPVTTIP